MDAIHFQQNITTNNIRQILWLNLITFITLNLIAFGLFYLFFNAYLNGIASSQNYSLATQEWRQVSNGIFSGWKMSPNLSQLCIFTSESNTLVYAIGECRDVISKSLFAGTKIVAPDVSGFKFIAITENSIWIWSTLVSLCGSLLILVFYLILRRGLGRRLEADILLFLNSYENDVKTLTSFQNQVKLQTDEIVRLKKQSALAELSRQVAHDIRSPLSAIEVGLASLKMYDDDRIMLINKAAGRLQEIANNLLAKNRFLASSKVKISPTQVAAEIIQEKLLLYKDQVTLRQIFSTELITLSVSAIELQRTLSNLLNNAIEACLSRTTGSQNAGLVSLAISKGGNLCNIQIIDNGVGIPKEILEKIGLEGFTHGKSSGNGLGLFQAIQTVKTWGGSLEIHSKVDVGTTVSLNIPLSD